MRVHLGAALIVSFPRLIAATCFRDSGPTGVAFAEIRNRVRGKKSSDIPLSIEASLYVNFGFSETINSHKREKKIERKEEGKRYRKIRRGKIGFKFSNLLKSVTCFSNDQRPILINCYQTDSSQKLREERFIFQNIITNII